MVLRRIAAFLIAVVAMLIVAELALRVLPVPRGVASGPPVAQWPAHHLIPGTDYVSSSGWSMANIQQGKINNRGYVAPFDYQDGASAGIVIGDSYIEGMMNPYAAMLQFQLAGALNTPQSSFYNFGTAGASLPHYLGIAKLAGQRYRPEWAVVMIVSRDFVDGFNKDRGFYHWTDGADLVDIKPELPLSTLKRMIRDLAIVRYARINLKFTNALFTQSGFEVPAAPRCEGKDFSARDRHLIEAWVDQMPQALNLPRDKLVLLFDADRSAIYRGLANTCNNRDQAARTFLANAARAAGVRVVDMAPIFTSDWQRYQQPLDRAPVDAHWNPRAHALAAQAIAKALRRH